MFRMVFAVLALFTVGVVGPQLIVRPTVWFDLFVTRLYSLPRLPFSELPDITGTLGQFFAIYPIIFFMFLIISAFLTLVELEW